MLFDKNGLYNIRIDYCDDFCYNIHVSFEFGSDQAKFSRVITVSFTFG